MVISEETITIKHFLFHISRLDLTRDLVKIKHTTTKVNQDTNASLRNDNEENNEKEKSLTNKENNTQKEKQISSSDISSYSIQKETDVITIESDDDNEIEVNENILELFINI